MSLLNEALRNIEQRQREPGAASAYTGQSMAVNRRRKAPWIMLGVLGVASISMASGYWLSSVESSPEPVVQPSIGGGVDVVERENNTEALLLTPVEAQTDPAESFPASAKQPEPLVEAKASPVKQETRAVGEETQPVLQNTGVEAPRQPETIAVTQPLPGTARSVAKRPEPAKEPNSPVIPDKERTKAVDQAQPTAVTEQTPVTGVRTTHPTPASRDRAAAVAIGDALANSRVDDARQVLADIVETQAAPRSRAHWVRHLLVIGEIHQALTWAPADIAADNADLRLLRARAQHALGHLDAAVATLEGQVPAVEADPDYAVTLATLLQQNGRYGQAATRWAELIAYDDSRSAWWVGLAIALESEQRLESAARAYVQALELPDLSASLRDFVLQRLRAFEVGGSNG